MDKILKKKAGPFYLVYDIFAEKAQNHSYIENTNTQYAFTVCKNKKIPVKCNLIFVGDWSVLARNEPEAPIKTQRRRTPSHFHRLHIYTGFWIISSVPSLLKIFITV